MLISSRSVHINGRHGQFLFLIGWFKENSSPQNGKAEWNQTWQEIFIQGPFYILSQSDKKHGHHGPWTILVSDWNIKNLLLWNRKQEAAVQDPRKFCSFCPIRKNRRFLFFFIGWHIKITSHLKPLAQMLQYFKEASTYAWSLSKKLDICTKKLFRQRRFLFLIC